MSDGMFECFHCGERTVIWGADFNGEDYGYLEPGIVHSLHCTNCNAEITYFVPTGETEENNEKELCSREQGQQPEERDPVQSEGSSRKWTAPEGTGTFSGQIHQPVHRPEGERAR